MGNDLRTQLEKLKEQNKKLKSELRKSYTDALTGLWNRNFFEKFKKKINGSQSPIGLVYIDANKLKFINDNYGHIVGDKYLADTGKLILDSIIRKSDFAFRLGGDEFLIVLALTGIDPEKGLNTVSDRIKTNISLLNKKRAEENKIEVSLAIGSVIRDKDSSLTDSILKAEDLMYECKVLQKKEDPSLGR